jgi:HK97 family phage portal protein
VAFFPTLLPRGRRSTEQKVLLSDYYSTLINAGIDVHTRSKPWPVERAVAEGYERVNLVFRSVNTIAGDCARRDIPFRFREGDKVLDDHPLYRLLNRRANPMEDSHAFRTRLVSQILLSKRGAFVEETRSNGGTPVRLDLLPPGRTRIVPPMNVTTTQAMTARDTGNDLIDHYEVWRNDGSRYDIDPERVRWFRNPHPLDPYSGTTPLESLGLTVELDYFARLYNTRFLRNDGRPGGVLAVKNDMEDDGMEQLEARFGKGPTEAGKLSVIAGEVSYVDLAARPRDMQYGSLAKVTKDDLLVGFGTPESVMGNAAGRTFDNAENEAYIYWSRTVMGSLSLVAAGFDDDASDDLEPFFDTEAIDVLQLPVRKRREEMRLEVTDGLRSPKSYADAAGYGHEIEDTPKTRALRQPAGVTLLAVRADDEDALAPAAPSGPTVPGPALRGAVVPESTPPGTTPQEDTAPSAAKPPPGNTFLAGGARATPAAADTPATPTATPKGDEQKRLPQPTSRVVVPINIKAAAAQWVDVSPADTEADAEAKIGDVLAKVMDGWLSRAVARVKSPKTRKGTRHWKADGTLPADTRGGHKALDVAYAADEDTTAKEIDAKTRPLVVDAALAAAAAYLTAAGPALLGGAEHKARAKQPPELDALVAAMRDGAKITVDMIPPDVGKRIRDRAQAIVPHLDAGARGQIRTAARAAAAKDADGGTVEDIVAQLEDRRDAVEQWARAAAADAAGAAAAVGHDLAAAQVQKALGGDVYRQWFSRHDEKTRDTHRGAHGQRRDIGVPFKVGAASLQYPKDPLGPPGEVKNCRCHAIYRHRRSGRFDFEVAAS